MARKVTAPCPKQRSIDDPSDFVTSGKVLALYNQENKPVMPLVNDQVKAWYEQRMKDMGWYEVEFRGKQCILTANIQLITHTTADEVGVPMQNKPLTGCFSGGKDKELITEEEAKRREESIQHANI